MKKVGLVMRKIQFVEAQSPNAFTERLRNIAKEPGVLILLEMNHCPDLVLEYASQNPGNEVLYCLTQAEVFELMNSAQNVLSKFVVNFKHPCYDKGALFFMHNYFVKSIFLFNK